MRFLYNLGVRLYGLSLFFLSFFNAKAKLWTKGRKNWKQQMNSQASHGIWMHCSSSGEFEQGRPVLELLLKNHPNLPVVLTFFSPSGFELRKNYNLATQVMYLPLDTHSNAVAFLDFFKPKISIFVKYDLWINFLEASLERKIPTILIAAQMNPNSAFLKYELYRKVLHSLDRIYVQRPEMIDLLRNAGITNKNIINAGDPRLDRCWEISNNGEPIPLIQQWLTKDICFVAGSVWPVDVDLIQEVIEKIGFQTIQWIIVPHELHESKLKYIKQKFPEAIFYSELEKNPEKKSNILIFDTMGMLSRLYRYSDLVYIGGGFGTSIHNTLEPAAWGNRIYFGPKHHKFPEAQEMINCQAALCVQEAQTFIQDVSSQIADIPLCKQNKMKSKQWMSENIGATKIIVDDLVQNQIIK